MNNLVKIGGAAASTIAVDVALRGGLNASRVLRDRRAQLSVKVPSMGDSITEGSVQTWKKEVGDKIEADEVVAIIDTDKISVEVISPVAGVLAKKHFEEEGAVVQVGDDFFEVDENADSSHGKGAPSVSAESKPVGGGPRCHESTATKTESKSLSPGDDGREVRRVPMSRMRQTIAQRLKQCQNETVSLTTFQQCDMGAIMDFRAKNQTRIQEAFGGQKLGFMSFFIKACCEAMKEYKSINYAIDADGKTILERDFVDMSVAVATPTGLVVPVLKNVEGMGLIDLERYLAETATLAKDGKLPLARMQGGSFTISNGGVFGSWMGTPVINPPQSAILGMHSINKIPVVRDGKIVVRPVMNLALTYDHRIVDGREGAGFLKKVADLISNPEPLMQDLQKKIGA